jgi:spore germination cell wall hydrolase CwlJ-like protein
MSRPVRAATIAALSFCALLAGYSAPSFADDRVTQPILLASLNAATNPYSLRVPAIASEAIAPVETADTPSETNLGQDGSAPTAIVLKPATLTALVSQTESQEIADRNEECLAGAVYFEAKSETLEGQLAVAEVIKNRAGSGRFPSSFCGVVFQASQFSFVRGGDLPPINRSTPAWRRAVAVAKIASAGLWQAVAPKALFFHASHVSPRWRNLTRVNRIGNHVFYR